MTKAKYRLLNEYGNRVEYTDSEGEKNILLNRGFHIDENWQKTDENKTAVSKKRMVVKSSAGKTKNKNGAESGIQ